jgi:uncharacterized protein YjiS (DUF1127 family)
MSRHGLGAPAAVATPAQFYAWSKLLNAAVIWMRTCRRRQRERQELLDYVASDHRAAADIGITVYDARNWANQPFWRLSVVPIESKSRVASVMWNPPPGQTLKK